MIRPATDREVLLLTITARRGGNGNVQVPAPALRALLARLDHAETGINPLPIRVDFGRPVLNGPASTVLDGAPWRLW